MKDKYPDTDTIFDTIEGRIRCLIRQVQATLYYESIVKDHNEAKNVLYPFAKKAFEEYEKDGKLDDNIRGKMKRIEESIEKITMLKNEAYYSLDVENDELDKQKKKQ